MPIYAAITAAIGYKGKNKVALEGFEPALMNYRSAALSIDMLVLCSHLSLYDQATAMA